MAYTNLENPDFLVDYYRYPTVVQVNAAPSILYLGTMDYDIFYDTIALDGWVIDEANRYMGKMDYDIFYDTIALDGWVIDEANRYMGSETITEASPEMLEALGF